LAGCASTKPSIEQSINVKDDPSLRVVAVDLISVLAQLPDFDSWSMTVQVSPTRTSYGKAVVDALTEVGYGIQRVSADQGQNHVEYKESAIVESTGTKDVFEIKVRGVRISRLYIRENNRWLPNSPILVFGAEPTPVKIYNELHSSNSNPTRFASGVVFHDTSGNVIESTESMVDVVKGSGSAAGISDLTKRALLLSQASTFSRQRTSAIHDNGNYKRVAEVILNFPSPDPTQLGQGNKQAIAALLKRSNHSKDRYVIQGCVQGKTLRWDGTESIALERQQRINKELIISGIKPGSIKELGCSADDSQSGLTRHAVNLILERMVEPL